MLSAKDALFNDIIVIGRLNQFFSNSTSPSMCLYQGLNKKKNWCLISLSMRTKELNT